MKIGRWTVWMCSSLAVGLFLAAGCGGGGGKNSPPPAGGATTSGGLATISANGKVTAFVPTSGGLGIMAVSSSSLGKVIMPKALRPSSVFSMPIVNTCAADPTDYKVVCASYSGSVIYVLDVGGLLFSGTAPVMTQFDPGNTVTASLSGGSCLDCGILTDPGSHRFILSSGDGYRVFTYTGGLLMSFTTNTSLTPPMNLATENFSFDPNTKRIISPEYETTGDYLWVIDLVKNKVYQWTKRMVGTSIDAANGLPELDANGVSTMTADAAAVDPSTGIVSIGHEWVPLLLNLNMSAASFNDGTGTFSAPYSVVPLKNVAGGGLLTTGMVLESSNHLMFLEEEFADTIGVAAFPSSAGSGGPSVTNYNSGLIPAPGATCPSATTWSNAGDPHGLALFTSVVNGNPMGLLVDNSKTCLAVVDLKAFLSASKQAGTNMISGPASFVTFYPVQ